jgi:hypothetical protein
MICALRVYPIRFLALWGRADFIGFLASPERVRPRFGWALSSSAQVSRCKTGEASHLRRVKAGLSRAGDGAVRP